MSTLGGYPLPLIHHTEVPEYYSEIQYVYISVLNVLSHVFFIMIIWIRKIQYFLNYGLKDVSVQINNADLGVHHGSQLQHSLKEYPGMEVYTYIYNCNSLKKWNCFKKTPIWEDPPSSRPDFPWQIFSHIIYHEYRPSPKDHPTRRPFFYAIL